VSASPHDNAPAEKLAADRKARATSIGTVASPLLAGFSFTNVIVIAMSTDTENFLLPGLAIITWVTASIAFIVSIQIAKYVPEKELTAEEIKRYENWTDGLYHIGVFAFLLGFGFALFPQHDSGSHTFRLVAACFAFAACVVEACVFVTQTKAWGDLKKRRRQPG
jgi:hypothetical protein